MMQTYKTAVIATSVALLAGCSTYLKQPKVCVDHWYGYQQDKPCPRPSTATVVAPDETVLRIAALERDLEAARRQNRVLSSQVSDLEGQLAASSLLAADLAAARQRTSDLEAQLADREKELSAEMARLKQAERGLLRALRPEVARGDIAVDVNSERLRINLASGYLFGSGEAQLKPAGTDALHQVGAILKEYPQYRVAVDGYSDNQPIGGALKKRYPTNKELSEARANNAAQALRDGGLTSNLSASGHGEINPVASNNTAEGRAKNRRVEVIVTQ